jgi:hypothetical protein
MGQLSLGTWDKDTGSLGGSGCPTWPLSLSPEHVARERPGESLADPRTGHLHRSVTVGRMGGPYLPAHEVLRRLGVTVSGFCVANGIGRMAFYAGASRGERWAVELLRTKLGDDVADTLAIPRTAVPRTFQGLPAGGTSPLGRPTSPASEAEASAPGTPRRPKSHSSETIRSPRDDEDPTTCARASCSRAGPRLSKARALRGGKRVGNPWPLTEVR